MAGGDEAEQGQRAQRPEPQRDARVGAQVPGQAGQEDHHQGHTDQLEGPEDQHLGDQRAARHGGQHLGGRRRRAGRRGKRCAATRWPPTTAAGPWPSTDGPDRVGVEPAVGDEPLGDVAVDVPAEQGGADEEGESPQAQQRPGPAERSAARPAPAIPTPSQAPMKRPMRHVEADRHERRPSAGRGEPPGGRPGSATEPIRAPVTTMPTAPTTPTAAQTGSATEPSRSASRFPSAPCTTVGVPTCLLQVDPPGAGPPSADRPKR